jgi:RNA polymerase sigma-70 factor (ECF subfamily)
MCSRREDADDLVQNTFLNALRYLDTFRGEARFKNWLFRIAVTRCLRMKREISGLREGTSLEGREDLAVGHADAVPAWTRKPDQVLLDKELRGIINESIAELPAAGRLVFVLRDQEGFTTAETAEIVSMSPGAVKTRLHRARAFLASRITAYLEEKSHAG